MNSISSSAQTASPLVSDLSRSTSPESNYLPRRSQTPKRERSDSPERLSEQPDPDFVHLNKFEQYALEHA
jgi:hypothetical protein